MQTYRNIEIIAVINGNCTDNTEPITLQYAENDKRIKIIKNNENSIIAKGLELGFTNMSGDYFTILEGDDYLGKNAIKDLTDSINEEDIDIVMGQIVSVDEKNVETGWGSRPFSVITPVDYLKYALPYMDFLVHGKLFKTTLYNRETIKLPSVFLGHDVLLVYQFVLNAGKIKNTPIEVHYYRKVSHSISHTMTAERLSESFLCHTLLYDILAGSNFLEDSEIKRLMETQVFRIMASCLIAGKHHFYTENKSRIKTLFARNTLDNKEIRSYLNGWKGVLFVLDIYRKMPVLANLMIYFIDFARKTKKIRM
jgi:glycosyltransferase involved in cell wall biosynthesis